RKEKPAWAIIFVDRLLDRQQQVGCALDLVDDRLVQAPDEASRVGLGSVQNRLVVECDIRPAGFAHFSDERRLPRPARSHDQDHGRIRQGLLRLALYKSFEHPGPRILDSLELSISADWKSTDR